RLAGGELRRTVRPDKEIKRNRPEDLAESRQVPMCAQASAFMATEHVNPRLIVELILPKTGGNVPDNRPEKSLSITVWCTLGEFRAVPLADKNHRLLAAEQPAITLNSLVCRCPQKCENDILGETGADPIRI